MARGRTLCRGPMPSSTEEELESTPNVGGPMPQPPPSWPSRPIGDNPSSSHNVTTSSQQVSEQIQSEESGDPSANNSERRTRGPTYMRRGWGTDGGVLHIETNELGQPILVDASKLASNLGVLARNGTLAPLNYYAWIDVPDIYKEQIWHHIKENIDATKEMRKILMQSVGKKWREWKSDLKRKYYSIYNTDFERLSHCPQRVQENQWRALIHYWGTEKANEKSRKNKLSRARQVTPHTTGRMSFDRVKQMMTEENGTEPSRRQVFKRAHTKKDGTIVNSETSQIIAKMDDLASQRPDTSDSDYGQDDIFSQVMGPDKPGSVRTFGLGPTPTQVFGSSYGKSQMDKRDIDNRVNEQIERMRVEMEANVEAMMAKLRKEMAAQFQEELKAQLLAMGCPVPQQDTQGTKQVADASSAHHMTSPLLHSNPLLARPQSFQSNGQIDQMRQRELCNSSSTNPNEMPYSRMKVKQVDNDASNMENKEVHLLSHGIPKHVVARGLIVSKEPFKVVENMKLGLNFWEMRIIKAVESCAKLVRPYGRYKIIGDVGTNTIAWPIGDVEEL